MKDKDRIPHHRRAFQIAEIVSQKAEMPAADILYVSEGKIPRGSVHVTLDILETWKILSSRYTQDARTPGPDRRFVALTKWGRETWLPLVRQLHEARDKIEALVPPKH